MARARVSHNLGERIQYQYIGEFMTLVRAPMVESHPFTCLLDKCAVYIAIPLLYGEPLGSTLNSSIGTYQQWRSQGGAHWGTRPTNLALCPTKFLAKLLLI